MEERVIEERKKQVVEFLKASKLNFDNGFYYISALLAEEALHLHLVLILLDRGVVMPWYLDFDTLFRILEKHEEVYKEFRKEKLLLKLLDQIRVEFRYSVPVKIDKDTARKIIDFTEKVINLNP